MCNNNNTTTCESCIADILKVILLLQQNVCGGDTCLQTCDRGFLGQNATSFFIQYKTNRSIYLWL